MFSHFFIDRPIFATVIAIIIMIAGAVAIPNLPIENTPDITPPTVVVESNFPGASAEVVTATVTSPLEQEINGVDDMIYMSSKSSNDGKSEITVTFKIGTNIDMATVLVQNRVSLAEPKLPEEVKRQGIKVEKRATNIVLLLNLYSPDESVNEIDLSNYASQNLKDELSRISGVGKVQIMGEKDYGMRIWLEPEKLAARELTTLDVVQALREQNVQVAAGQIGQPPNPSDQEFQYTVNTLGRLTTREEFEEIILKVSDSGAMLRVKDVARVELGSQNYNWYVQLDGLPSVALAVYQLPGANAIAVSDGVQKVVTDLAKSFPRGIEHSILYNTTDFIHASIQEVVSTLFIAILLVVFTVWIFLQDFRTTLIPSITIPVSLIGTFAVMGAIGLSINTLTLFGLVLAIGIVVDDAIVVVENTLRLMDSEKLSAREATKKAMLEITGPVIATTMVLLAVFLPTAFLPGITGQLYRQFALTIATATVFSSINALTLSPALCGILLRPTPEKRVWFFTLFNNAFEKTTNVYMKIVGVFLRRSFIGIVFFLGFVALTLLGFMNVPAGFLPNEDQGYIFVNALLPDGATLNRSEEILDELRRDVDKVPEVKGVITIGGYSMLDSLISSNAGAMFVVLNPWEDRPAPEQHALAISTRFYKQFSRIPGAQVLSFGPPPIMGLGNAGGFEFQLQDRGAIGLDLLEQTADDIIQMGNQHPALTRLNSNFRTSSPQYFLDVDRAKVKRLQIPLSDVFEALQAFLGSLYINDFNRDGRVYRVMIQADQQYRKSIEDIQEIRVRSKSGKMIPLSTLVTAVPSGGPQSIFRFNLHPAALLTGDAAPGFSSGDTILAMQDIARNALPPSMSYEWSGVTFQQIEAGDWALVIFGLALILVFLFLAAQYESWSIPLAVMLTVPLAVCGAILATWAVSLDNNIYTQVGLVLLIGLASKNAILIVEFAKQERESGKSILEAATQSCLLRFRPILMTALSFILGVIPLVIATGAGAASRRSLGTAVFGGMLLVTIGGIFLTPVFYLIVQSLSEKMRGVSDDAIESDSTSETSDAPA